MKQKYFLDVNKQMRKEKPSMNHTRASEMALLHRRNSTLAASSNPKTQYKMSKFRNIEARTETYARR